MQATVSFDSRPLDRIEESLRSTTSLNTNYSNRQQSLPSTSPRTASTEVDKEFDNISFTVEEVMETREILISLGLVIEVAHLILDHAEYWCRQQFSCKTPLRVANCGGCHFPDTSSLYLQTGPLGHGEGLDEHVKPAKVVFRILSSDRGFRNFLSNKGSYPRKGNFPFSWFDVSIFREDESWTAGSRIEPKDTLIRESPKGVIYNLDAQTGNGDPVFYYSKDPNSIPYWMCQEPDWSRPGASFRSKLKGGFKVVRHEWRRCEAQKGYFGDGTDSMWLLQRNIIGVNELTEHRVEWRNDHIEETEDEEWPSNGAGLGRGFVASLRRGDRIGVWARTVFLSIQNFVQSVEVDVYYSIW